MSYAQNSEEHQRWRGRIAWLAVAILLVAGCGAGGGEAESTATSSLPQSTTTTTTAVPTTTSTVARPTPTTVATISSRQEPPVIELAGYTTVFSQDGQVRLSGWLDRPAEVRVGDNPVEVFHDQYQGISTFETLLELEPDEYSVPITATDSQGLETKIHLSVLVDPALEVELALVDQVDLVERTVVADHVEFLTGDEATSAAREDGVIGENEETPGGFYLRNSDPQLRKLTLGDPEVVTLLACFEQGPCAVEHAVGMDTWAELLASPDMAEEQLGWFWYGAGLAPYWLTLQDGVIVQIVEQYLP